MSEKGHLFNGRELMGTPLASRIVLLLMTVTKGGFSERDAAEHLEEILLYSFSCQMICFTARATFSLPTTIHRTYCTVQCRSKTKRITAVIKVGDRGR